MRLTAPTTKARTIGLAIAILILSLIGLLACSPVSAAAEPKAAAGSINLEVKAGLDGLYKENRWLPLQVTITGDQTAPAFDGYLEAVNAVYDFGTFTTYRRAVQLSPPYKKTIWLYMDGRRVNRVAVRLVDKSGQTIALTSKFVRPLTDTEFLLGVVSDDTSALGYLGGVEIGRPFGDFSSLTNSGYRYSSQSSTPGVPKIAVAHLLPSDLPPNVAGMSGLDGLVITDLTTSTLDQPEVQNNIGGWLAGGRALFVAGDSGIRRAQALLPLLPVTVNGAPKNVNNLDALRAFIAPGNDSAPPGNFVLPGVQLANGAGASNLVAQDGQTLIATRPYGLGQSWYVGVEFNAIKNWAGAVPTFRKLLADYTPQVGYPTLVRQAGAASYYGSDGSSRITPNPDGANRIDIVPIGLFLVLYILIIGPVVYLVLKRFDRRELAWVVVPGLTVLFAVAAYFIGTSGGSREISASNITIIVGVQGDNGALQGQGYSLTTLYGNRRSDYTVKVGEEALTNTAFNWRGNISYNGRNVVFTENILQGAGGGFEKQTLLPRERRSVAVEASPNSVAGGGLVADVRLVNGAYTGTIENTSNYEWRDVRLFEPGSQRILDIGTLQPKEKREVGNKVVPIDLNLVQTLAGTEKYNPIPNSAGYYSSDRTTLYRLVNDKYVPDPNYQRAVVLESLMGLKGEGLPKANNRFYLIGWGNRSNLPLDIRDATVSPYNVTLLFEALVAKS